MVLKYNQKYISVIILAVAFVISGYIVASAQTAGPDTTQSATTQTETLSPAQITFPIPELGNCADKNSCKSYCDIAENAESCLSFAESHRLMKSDEIARARKMASIARTGGPGGCKNKGECANYCEASTDRLTECLAFAEKTGLVPQEELRQMRQVHSALASGAKLPGGCKNKGECENYCSDSSRVEECISFAEASGMLKGKELDEAKKVLPFIKRGETPGGCKTKETCQTYCSDSSHATECVSFAEKAGFISKEEADIVRKTGGRGPGGCNSKESCETFCNQKENQQACFSFAKEHNLIPAEELKKMEEGTARLRVGLSQMPGEVVQCLKNKIGADAVGQIESGKLAPSRDIGEVIQGCFNEFKPQMTAKIQEGLKNAPPEVSTCLQNSLGAEDFQKMQQGDIDSPEKGDKVKECFEKMREVSRERMQDGARQLDGIPAEARDCVKQKLGGDFFEKMQSGDPEQMKGLDQRQIQSVIGQCMTQNIAPGNIQSGDGQTGPTPEQIRGMIERKEAPGVGDIGDIREMMEKRGFPANAPGAPTQEQLKEMIQNKMPPASGSPTPEQIKEMLQKSGSNEQKNNRGEFERNRPSDISGAPSAEQLKEMIQRNMPSIAPGARMNTPTGPASGQTGPTPEQLKNMMQNQIPQIPLGVPQAIQQNVPQTQGVFQPAPAPQTTAAPQPQPEAVTQ